jgi:hypothetical protein
MSEQKIAKSAIKKVLEYAYLYDVPIELYNEAECELAELLAIKDRMASYKTCEALMGEDLSDYPKGEE